MYNGDYTLGQSGTLGVGWGGWKIAPMTAMTATKAKLLDTAYKGV